MHCSTDNVCKVGNETAIYTKGLLQYNIICTTIITVCVIVIMTIKWIRCEVPFFGGSALLIFYSVGAMASCNYIPHKVK